TLGVAGFERGYAEGSLLWIVNNIYFQYFSVLITIVSAIVMVVVSRMTAAPDPAAIASLTYATSTDADRRRTRARWQFAVLAASAAVVAGIVGAYLYFSG